MVRIMLGQGRLMTRMPPAPWGMSWPVSSTTAAAMPGSGSVQLPGTSGVAPGSGAITWPPGSVCQKGSTMGQRSGPTLLGYHIQGSGVIGPAGAAQDAQATRIRARRVHRSVGLGGLDQRADGRGGGVEDRAPVPLDHLPKAP